MRKSIFFCPLILSVMLAACAEGPTEQTLSAEASIALLEVIGGDDQVGVVGEELRNPLVVRALDDRGRPIRRQVVNFVVTEGGGRVYAGAALTDHQGFASEYWTLGESLEEGGNRLEVRAVDPASHSKQLFATFVATGVSGPPPGDPIAEVCDGTDTSGNGLIDDGLRYCFNGEPAPNTDGAACLDGYYDMDGLAETGCESDLPAASICYSTLDFDFPALPLGWSVAYDGVEEGIDAMVFGGPASLDLLIQAYGGVTLSNEGAIPPEVDALTIGWNQRHMGVAEYYETRFTAGDPESGDPWWRIAVTRSEVDWTDRYRLDIGDAAGSVQTIFFPDVSDGFHEGQLTHFFTFRVGGLHIETRMLGEVSNSWQEGLPGFTPFEATRWSFEVRSWEGGDDGGTGHDWLNVYDFSSRCTL